MAEDQMYPLSVMFKSKFANVFSNETQLYAVERYLKQILPINTFPKAQGVLCSFPGRKGPQSVSESKHFDKIHIF